MPRMFDILRGKNKPQEEDFSNDKKPEPQPKDQPLAFPKEILKLDIKKEKKPENHTLISKKLISAVRKHGVDNQEKASEIYGNGVETVKALLVKVRNGEDISQYMDRLYELLDNVFNQLVMGDNILNDIYGNKKEEYFLPEHIINVLILSSVIALNMGFNKSRLSHLGLASIFYDVGMDALRDITDQPRMLTKEEYSRIKNHIPQSLEIVEKIDNINEVVKETIRMHHEKVSGYGYPSGIKYDEINPYAKILGLVDTYEAITHNRPYREGMTTHKAVRFLVTSLKSDFDADVVKVFINKMSVYPIGSIVTLDTGEVARVISVQSGSPMRPAVMILRNPEGEPVSERIIIDLSKQAFPSIRESII